MLFVRIPTHVYLYPSFTSICRPLRDGTKFTEDSITVAFTTISLIFLKTCKRALWRHVHRIYLSGGLCKSAFHRLEQTLTYVCLVEKSSQLPPLASGPALLLLARLWRNSVPLAAEAILAVFRERDRIDCSWGTCTDGVNPMVADDGPWKLLFAKGEGRIRRWPNVERVGNCGGDDDVHL